MTLDDRALMELRADTDFTYDARERMLLSNEPREQERRPAPRLFVGRTRTGDVIRFGSTVPDGLAQRLERIIDRSPPSAELRVPPTLLAALRQTLAEQAPITVETAGPAYRFPPSLPGQSAAVELTEANIGVARDSYPWLLDELADWWPCFAVVREGAAVSVCFSARRSAAAAEAGVDTLAAFRGRGYATDVSAAWAAAVRASGRTPLYSTSWENHASQGVARRLGLVMFGADATWT